MGLLGIVTYTTGMVLAITVALHDMVRRLQADFNLVVLLTFVASLGLQRLYSPRPWHFTILFFVIVLNILLYARRTGQVRELAWLPIIFALWANLHIQFVDGLIVLALAAAESMAGKWWEPARTRLRTGWIVTAAIASLAATLANPYGWRVYKTAYELASQPGVMDHISELQSIPFRYLSDYCVLFLALAAAAVLARSRRVQVFETALLLFAAIVSFRSRRDVWVMASIGAAIIAIGVGKAAAIKRPRTTFWAGALTAFATALIMLIGFRSMHIDNAKLSSNLADAMPVKAVQFVKDNGYSGPLYNDYSWGGYLMWGLRQQVSVDGRAGVQGSDRLTRFGDTWGAQRDWQADPDLKQAGLVIGPVTAPLSQILRLDPRFKVAYEDKVAVVFVPRAALATEGSVAILRRLP